MSQWFFNGISSDVVTVSPVAIYWALQANDPVLAVDVYSQIATIADVDKTKGDLLNDHSKSASLLQAGITSGGAQGLSDYYALALVQKDFLWGDASTACDVFGKWSASYTAVFYTGAVDDGDGGTLCTYNTSIIEFEFIGSQPYELFIAPNDVNLPCAGNYTPPQDVSWLVFGCAPTYFYFPSGPLNINEEVLVRNTLLLAYSEFYQPPQGAGLLLVPRAFQTPLNVGVGTSPPPELTIAPTCDPPPITLPNEVPELTITPITAAICGATDEQKQQLVNCLPLPGPTVAELLAENKDPALLELAQKLTTLMFTEDAIGAALTFDCTRATGAFIELNSSGQLILSINICIESLQGGNPVSETIVISECDEQGLPSSNAHPVDFIPGSEQQAVLWQFLFNKIDQLLKCCPPCLPSADNVQVFPFVGDNVHVIFSAPVSEVVFSGRVQDTPIDTWDGFNTKSRWGQFVWIHVDGTVSEPFSILYNKQRFLAPTGDCLQISARFNVVIEGNFSWDPQTVSVADSQVKP